jgi:iron-sulfur cluster assembly protein
MAVSRLRLAVMKLTDAAAARVNELVDNSDVPALGLRVGIKNAGCAGMSYTMDLATEERPGDEKVSDKGVTVYIDPKAVMFLLGTEMDFERTTLRSGFVFRNPNEVSSCGCGESVSLKAAEVA